MHRIERKDLAIQLSVAMKVALRQCKPLLKPTRLPHESDILANALADAAVDVVDGDCRMVIATDLNAFTPNLLAQPGKLTAGNSTSKRSNFQVAEQWQSRTKTPFATIATGRPKAARLRR